MYSDPKYKDITMDVTVVRGENCLYVQGIAKNCHDSWIKIEISEDMTDDRLLMLSNQPVTASGETQYINTGAFNYEWDSGTRHISFEIIAWGSDTPLSLYRDLSYEGVKYAAKEKTGYWLAVVPNHRFDECVAIWTSPYSPRKESGGIPEEELFKEKECVNRNNADPTIVMRVNRQYADNRQYNPLFPSLRISIINPIPDHICKKDQHQGQAVHSHFDSIIHKIRHAQR